MQLDISSAKEPCDLKTRYSKIHFQPIASIYTLVFIIQRKKIRRKDLRIVTSYASSFLFVIAWVLLSVFGGMDFSSVHAGNQRSACVQGKMYSDVMDKRCLHFPGRGAKLGVRDGGCAVLRF